MAINHTGYFDFTYAGLSGWPTAGTCGSWRRSRSLEHRVSGPLMSGMHHIPVDRDRGGESFAAAIRALRAGEIVGVFPEATMSRSFELKEFKSGIAQMAQGAGVPVLPVTIWGGQRVWTKDQPRRMGRANIPLSSPSASPSRSAAVTTSLPPPPRSRP